MFIKKYFHFFKKNKIKWIVSLILFLTMFFNYLLLFVAQKLHVLNIYNMQVHAHEQLYMNQTFTEILFNYFNWFEHCMCLIVNSILSKELIK